MKRKLLIMVLFSLLMVSTLGCKKEYWPNGPVFQYDGILYIMTYETVTQDKVEKEIGSITTEISARKPTNDGEAIKLEKGTRLYKMVGAEINEKESLDGVIIVGYESRYCIARKINDIQGGKKES